MKRSEERVFSSKNNLNRVHKVPLQAKFFDWSDYSRPIAERIAFILKDTMVSPIHVTLFYSLLGIVSAYLFSIGNWATTVIAAILLVMKSMLDAVDGALARARNKPSRVGRFLDSNMDFVINLSVLLGISIGYDLSILYLILAFLSMEIQGSFYNYFYLRYRYKYQGDTTSRLKEGADSPYPYDNPILMKLLFYVYQVFYGWQDRFVNWVVRVLRVKPRYKEYRDFMSKISIFGLGFHLLILSLFSLFNHPNIALFVIITVFNFYLVVLLLTHRVRTQK